MTEKFHKIQDEFVRIALDQNKFQQTMTIATSLVGQAVGYACYGFAAFRLWQGQISYGTMTMFVSMAGLAARIFQRYPGTAPHGHPLRHQRGADHGDHQPSQRLHGG